MAGEEQLLPHGGRSPRPLQVLYAQVSTLQPAPAAFTDPLFVVLPYDPDHALRMNGWPVIHGQTLPALGADVTVVVDDQHNHRVVWWDGVYS